MRNTAPCSFQEVLETPHVNNSGTYGNQYACKDGERNELDERTEAAEETRNGIANTLTDEFLVRIVLRFRDIVGNDRGQQGVNGAEAGKGESGAMAALSAEAQSMPAKSILLFAKKGIGRPEGIVPMMRLSSRFRNSERTVIAISATRVAGRVLVSFGSSQIMSIVPIPLIKPERTG